MGIEVAENKVSTRNTSQNAIDGRGGLEARRAVHVNYSHGSVISERKLNCKALNGTKCPVQEDSTFRNEGNNYFTLRSNECQETEEEEVEESLAQFFVLSSALVSSNDPLKGTIHSGTTTMDGQRSTAAQSGACSPALDTYLGHRLSQWESSGSIIEKLEYVSVDRPAFQDTSRSRNLSSCELPASVSRLSPTTQQPRDYSTGHATYYVLIALVIIVTLLFFLYYLLRDTGKEAHTVKAKWGTYRGFREEFDGLPVFTFLGIRFGKNTTGSLRFKRPYAVEYLDDVPTTDATHQKLPCTQASMTPWLEEGRTPKETSEDCLHLNLWTPSLPGRSQGGKTVLVFFYGYAFKWGSNQDYNASPLCALGDVIVVVPNYRLHALGFLGDGSDDAPGNVALHDQLLALDWVRQNIVFFGGNTSSIVLHGYEAGAVAIGYHMVSPVDTWVKTLSRLILQSGSLYRPTKRNAYPSEVMELLGCARGGWPCLRTLKEAMYKSPSIYQNMDFGPSFMFPYLPENLSSLIRNHPLRGKQVLLGNVLDEGRYQVELHQQEMKTVMDMVSDPLLTLFVNEEMKSVGVRDFDSLRRLYANDSEWNREDQGNEVAKVIYADVLFNCPVQYLAEHLASHGSTAYMYVWAHKPSFGPWARDSFGPVGYDDLAFVFGKPLLGGSSTSDERNLSRRTIELFSNFAKTGSLPQVDGQSWPEYTKANRSSVEIKLNGLQQKHRLLESECENIRKYVSN
ncbi:acetylcholinesterase-1-like [Ornithodoros turicata]|uniref:acetylcholinesterase-1-like n=1 Tax=Ornithodoros turicata TaxID=34597 RepID=UPI003138731D